MKADTAVFRIGDQVWFRAKPDMTGFVTGVLYEACGISYSVRWSDFSSRYHYCYELSGEKVFETAAQPKECA